MENFDVIVIGAGPAGLAAVFELTRARLKVLCVEKNGAGGTCLNAGCIPTKSLLKSAEVLRGVRDAAEFGVNATVENADFPKVRLRAEAVVSRLKKGAEFAVKKSGAQYLAGDAKIVSSALVEVCIQGEKKVFGAEKILIASGCEPRKLAGCRYDGERILTSADALKLSRVPESALIVGAGAIGAEFAQLWNSFGARVFLVEAAGSVLPLEDPECSAVLARIFRKSAISISTSARLKSAQVSGGLVEAEVETSAGVEKFCADVALICAGVEPNAASLFAEGSALPSTDSRGFLKVDSLFKTDVENIYAAGDIIGAPLLAHAASREGVLAARSIVSGECGTFGECCSCVYTSPPAASVGLSEKSAREKFGEDIGVSKVSFLSIGRAVAAGETDGFAKLVFLKGSKKLLGAQIVGAHADEMIAECALALKLGATLPDIAETVHPHPSFSEAIAEAARNA